jgi:long-subunit acyl-CoA synthetase (AMP-forming)
LARFDAHPSTHPAIVGDAVTLTYAELRSEVARFASALRARKARVLATLLDNGPACVIADLAALNAGVVHVPIPSFFTAKQATFVLSAAGVDTLLSHDMHAEFVSSHCELAGARAALGTREARSVAIPDGTAKITFTSGTTGSPKGVCLSVEAMYAVANGLAIALQPLDIERHLCALPLPVLLENVGGIYAPLLTGATSVVLPMQKVGLEGSSRFDPSALDRAVREHGAHSVIVLPQMLRAWSAWRGAQDRNAIAALRFVAVGGATVGAGTIEKARASGIPAYEGYGLSEAASVQTLNLPGADRPGSVGRPLPNAQVRLSSDGEIEVAGSVMRGYLGASAFSNAWWPTGDVGTIDDDGYVFVRGRKKNVLITAFGRNVSPEWVEAELTAQRPIAHAVVQGDGKPSLEGVLWARDAIGDDELARAVAAANAALPDYARLGRFVRARVPFSPEYGVCTPNGRPLRQAVEQMHASMFITDSRCTGVVL